MRTALTGRPRSAPTWTLLLVATGIAASGMIAAAADPPPWAYPRVPSDARIDPDDGRPRSVPGSARTFTLTEIRNFFAPPDWHDDHPPMPGLVGQGRPPMAFACGYCHLPSGIGKPENARVAGLPAAYIKQQVDDFRSGARKSSAIGMLPHVWMVEAAKAATDEEIDVAYEEGTLYLLTLHPHLIGMRSRVGYLDELLRYIKSKPNVWFATGAEIARYVRDQTPRP